jgi:signal transduction histidine kinase
VKSFRACETGSPPRILKGQTPLRTIWAIFAAQSRESHDAYIGLEPQTAPFLLLLSTGKQSWSAVYLVDGLHSRGLPRDSAGGRNHSMTKAKIFVVEDEEIVSLALQRALTKLGYSVAGAETSGEAALETIASELPDLVLMDIRLDGKLDGVDAADQIRTNHNLPVIYLTGYGDPTTLARAKITEPFAYILKPVDKCELQVAIETSLYRHASEGRVRQLQKMESVGCLAAGLAHDFNNLLTVIQGHADTIRSGAENARPLDGIDHAVEHGAKLTRHLLTFTRQQRVELRPIDINSVVDAMRGMLDRLLDATVSIRFHPATDLPFVQADAAMLEQVLMNLAVNSRDAMPGGGEIRIRTFGMELDESSALLRGYPGARPGKFVCLEVADTGGGMDEATLRRACEPFFTTKEVGQGTGLGLSTVYGIAQQHLGWLELESQPGRGTVCRLLLPGDSAQEHVSKPGMPTPHPEKAIARNRGATILLVEDEAVLRELVAHTLIEAGYRIIPAASGLEALSLWEIHAVEIDLVVTDMVMPDGISGRELAKRLSAYRPGLKIIYTSGYSLDLTDPQFASGQPFHFLEKPFRSAQLLDLLQDCLHPGARAQAA